jgi:hypothetical protein
MQQSTTIAVSFLTCRKNITMDISAYFSLLDQNTGVALALVRSIDEKKLRMAPEGKWSPLEIMEHIVIVEKAIHNRLSQPSDLLHEKEEVHGPEKIEHLMVTLRDRKVVASDASHPKGNVQSVSQFEELFQHQRNALKDDLSTGTLIVDNRMYPHIRLGDVTVADWLNFLVFHTQRHLEQIKDRLHEGQQVV